MHLFRYNTVTALPILCLRKAVFGDLDYLFPLSFCHLPARMDFLADESKQFFALAPLVNPVFILVLSGYRDGNDVAFSVPIDRNDNTLNCHQVAKRMKPSPIYYCSVD